MSDREEFLALAEKYERAGDPIMAGLMRVEAHNDRSNWVKRHKPSLGPYGPNNPGSCEDCGKPWVEWKGTSEPCPGSKTT